MPAVSIVTLPDVSRRAGGGAALRAYSDGAY
jgi:hypothetical protein